MTEQAGIWRRRLALWLPALVVLLVSLAFLSAYRFLLAGQSQLRQSRLERLDRQLGELESEHSALQELVDRLQSNQLGIEQLHQTWLSTEAERLTAVITEVKTLARRARLQSSGFSYPDEVLEEYGLIKRSIAFSITGSYSQLRQFVNLLELSDQFLMLEEIRLSDSGQDTGGVRVDVRLATLFRHSDLLEAPAERSRSTA